MEKFGLRATGERGLTDKRNSHAMRIPRARSNSSQHAQWQVRVISKHNDDEQCIWVTCLVRRKKLKLFREDVDFCSPLVNLYTDSQNKALAVAQPRRVVLVAASPCRKTRSWCMAKSNEAPRSFATSRRTSPSSLKSAAWRIWWRSTVTWLASTQWYWSIFWADLKLFSKLVLGTFKASSLPNHHQMKSLNFMLVFPHWYAVASSRMFLKPSHH